MGKTIVTHFTKEQSQFLSLIRGYPLILSTFYLTGGTALSACYYNHRLSEDIDLFSPKPFDQTFILSIMRDISKKMKAKSKVSKIHESLRYDMVLPHNRLFKIDFVPYLFSQIKKPWHLDGIAIDSIEDISVNKLLAISQRTTSKDYVDLYEILKTYTLWDLRIGVEHKFGMEMEPLYIASLFKNVDLLTDMPRMKKSLSLDTIKNFFTSEAKRLAMTMIKP